MPLVQLIAENGTALKVALALVATASAPTLGFLLSSVYVEIGQILLGYSFHVKVPKNPELICNYFAKMRALLNDETLRSDLNRIEGVFIEDHKRLKKVSRRDGVYRDVHLYFNLILRLKAPQELLSYSLRRWNIFWTHINTLSSIVLGVLSGYIAVQIAHGSPRTYDAIGLHQLLFLTVCASILFYGLVAVLQIKRTQRDATEIEYMWLLECGAEDRIKYEQQAP
jgi:hypothetical protein